MSRSRYWVILLILIMVFVVGVLPVLPQDEEQPQAHPLVAFIVDDTLQTASVADPGPDGVSRLADIFRRQGARTTFIRLREPVPADVSVIVLIRPRRPLPTAQLARLWDFMEQGGNLLLAIDPLGHNGANSERSTGGLAKLLYADYGTGYVDDFVTEAWFSHENLSDIRQSFTQVEPDSVLHPVIGPLAAYDIPVQIWGARSISVDPLGPDSIATPLLVTRTAYGETGRSIFARSNPMPLELNLGEDIVGALNVGALAVNSRTGSRIVTMGDGEFFQNDFGLAPIPGTQEPLFPGNRILIERMVAWLLGRPEENWPALPSDFTWININGDGLDWDEALVSTTDVQDDTFLIAYDIRKAETFRNDLYLYILVDTSSPPEAEVRINIGIDNDGDGAANVLISAGLDNVVTVDDSGDITVVNDGQVARQNQLEARIPLRVTGIDFNLTALCLSTSFTALEAGPLDDCLDELLPVPTLQQNEPFTIRFPRGPLASVNTTDRARLRGGPGSNFNVLTSFPHGQILEVTGRNEAGDWIKVQNARYSGWIADFLVRLNTDKMSLPVVEEEAP